MTQDKALKTSVRARMAATGEDYPTALRAIQAERGTKHPLAEQAAAAGTEPWRSVPWNAPLNSYYVTRDVAGQEGNVDG